MNKFSSMHTSHIRKSVLLGFLLAMPVLFNSTFPKSKLQVIFFLIFLFFIRFLIGFQLPFAFFCSFEFSFSTLNRNIPETDFYPHIYIHFYSYSQGLYQRFESNWLPFSLMFYLFLFSTVNMQYTYPRPLFTHTFTSIICLAVGSTFF